MFFRRAHVPNPTFQERVATLQGAGAETLRDLGLRLHWIKEWDPHKGLTDQQLADIKRTIARRWPVGGGFLWPKRRVLG